MSTYLLFTKVFAKYGLTARLVEPTDLKAVAGAINDTDPFYLSWKRSATPSWTSGSGRSGAPGPRQRTAADRGQYPGHPLSMPSLGMGRRRGPPFHHQILERPRCRPWGAWSSTGVHSPGLRTGFRISSLLSTAKAPWPSWTRSGGNTTSISAPPPPLFIPILTMIGLDTLALRMERTLANASRLARFLKDRSEVTWVNYPGFDEHPSQPRPPYAISAGRATAA